MSKENKGREFWIVEREWPNQTSVFHLRPSEGSPCWRRKTETVHHVIFYEDFEKCQAENEKLTDEIWQATEANAAANMKIDALEQRLADAVELLEAVQHLVSDDGKFQLDWRKKMIKFDTALADGSKDD